MNTNDFKRVFNEAKNNDINWSEEYKKIDILTGCGTQDYTVNFVTLRTAAAHVRYQCMLMNGGWSQTELNECKENFRKRVFLLD